MKLSNETKVGLLAIIAILVLVVGFNFLKGNSVFSKEPVLYAKFRNIGSLEKSNSVKINGFTIGKVYDFHHADKEVNEIVVEIHLTEDVNIPKNSVAVINASVLGAALINIEKGASNAYLQPGDTIATVPDKDILANIQAQLSPTIGRVNETLDSLKLTIGALNSVFDPNTKNNLRSIIANLATSTAYLQQLLNTQSGMLAQSLGNINSVTGNLARNNDAINSSLRNIEATTAQLANANIPQVVTALRGTIEELKATVSRFNTNEGTLGLLMNDRELYDRLNGIAQRLNRTALSAEILIDDIRVNPKRYVNIAVFGKKNTSDALTSPAVKDTIPKQP
ncbi:MAG TPA: MlaD family protein [Flavisolibacter sp.]|jgi:phospholipid/cholesterol/gamma-HCH transport system substrate-binding protein